jgi:hypothetical protein
MEVIFKNSQKSPAAAWFYRGRCSNGGVRQAYFLSIAGRNYTRVRLI